MRLEDLEDLMILRGSTGMGEAIYSHSITSGPQSIYALLNFKLIIRSLQCVCESVIVKVEAGGFGSGTDSDTT